jgi:hypothetical protein
MERQIPNYLIHLWKLKNQKLEGAGGSENGERIGKWYRVIVLVM